MPKSFSIVDRIKSFGFALAGIAAMLRTQHNAWIHAAATVVICVLGGLLGITSGEWLAVMFKTLRQTIAKSNGITGLYPAQMKMKFMKDTVIL